MSTRGEIDKLFSELSRSGSVEMALRSCLGLFCREAGCLAALAVSEKSTVVAGEWGRYGPDDQVRRLHDIHVFGVAGASPGSDDQHLVRRLPLFLGDREVGIVLLAGEKGMPRGTAVENRLGPLQAILATLVAAAESTMVDPADRVLPSSYFRGRLSDEVARAKRNGLELSFVLARPGERQPSFDGQGTYEFCSQIVSLAGWLSQRLRSSDVIGLLGPAQLGMILVDTDRVGTMIAVRRMASLLSSFRDEHCGSNGSSAPWELAYRCYPTDGADADSLVESTMTAMSRNCENTTCAGHHDLQPAGLAGGGR